MARHNPSGGGSTEWETPPVLFDCLNLEYDFTLDGAASKTNAKLPRFSTREEPISWSGERVWCNPPYDAIETWLELALVTTQTRPRTEVVLLLPARTDAEWFLRFAPLALEVWLFRGRVQFIPAEGVERSSNGEGSLLLRYVSDRSVCRGFGVRDSASGAILRNLTVGDPSDSRGTGPRRGIEGSPRVGGAPRVKCLICGAARPKEAQIWSDCVRGEVHRVCLEEVLPKLIDLSPKKQRALLRGFRERV